MGIVQPAIEHSIEQNFKLYMTYDQSCESKGGSIPTNILINAIVDLNGPFHFKKYKNRHWTYWSEYYGNGAWEPILTYIRDHTAMMIDAVFEYNDNNHSAFPSNSNFVASLSHATWIEIFYKNRANL
jgi:hypothetical protein